MSEQRIETGAEAATSTDADPGDGLGLASPESSADPLDPSGPRPPGGDPDVARARADQPAAAAGAATGSADTEGARSLQEAQQIVEAQQSGGGQPDLGGREPAGDAVGGSGTAGAAEQPRAERAERPGADTGEVSAPPSPQRRAADPGSVEAEFADRADTAPADEDAHPSI
jgi:hypothetical protein